MFAMPPPTNSGEGGRGKISFPSYGDLLIPFLALEPKWPYDHFDWVRGYIIVDLIIKAAALAFRPLRPEEE